MLQIGWTVYPHQAGMPIARPPNSSNSSRHAYKSNAKEKNMGVEGTACAFALPAKFVAGQYAHKSDCRYSLNVLSLTGFCKSPLCYAPHYTSTRAERKIQCHPLDQISAVKLSAD